MNKEKLNVLMKEIDKTKKPKHWQKFINERTEDHNLILKYGKRAFCTHCQKYFDKDVKIHPYEKEKCPLCKHEYYVANNNIKNFTISKYIAFYTKYNGTIVLRLFDVESNYNHKLKKFISSLQEYARFIPQIRNNN